MLLVCMLLTAYVVLWSWRACGAWKIWGKPYQDGDQGTECNRTQSHYVQYAFYALCLDGIGAASMIFSSRQYVNGGFKDTKDGVRLF